uniref:Uncharacterized protein n=1 Tax=Rhizophora mucronata TaxID=61149 RepID=A0A2P2QAG4_RHIMU
MSHAQVSGLIHYDCLSSQIVEDGHCLKDLEGSFLERLCRMSRVELDPWHPGQSLANFGVSPKSG